MRLQANTETMNTKWEADNVTKKIFKSNILVAVVVLIFGIACVMAILYQHFGKQIDTELKKRGNLSGIWSRTERRGLSESD